MLSKPSAAVIAACLAMSCVCVAKARVADLRGEDTLSQATILRDDVLKTNVAWDYLAELTTRFGARPAGSESEKQAALWAADRLKSMGFANVHIESFPLSVWSRGEVDAVEITAPFPQKLVGTALGQSRATPADGIEAEAVMFDTYARFAASDVDVKGKIVVILQPMSQTSIGAGYGRISGPIRSGGPIAAAKRGAVGFIMRSAGTDTHRFAHTGTTTWQEKDGVPAMAISVPDAEALSRIKTMQKRGEAGPLRLRFTTGGKFPGLGTSQNVVAEIPGSEHPEEMIVIGGHMDSWDLGTGAIDDGAGQAITIAAAKAILDHGLHPKRTIRVVLWGSEEVSQPTEGHSPGGAAYARAHAAETPHIVIAGESDLGADRVTALALPPSADKTFVVSLSSLTEPLGIYFDAKAVPGGGSDSGPLHEAGVPAIDFKQDSYTYFNIHHTADDVLDRVDPAQMTQNVAAWTTALWLIANSDVSFRAKPETGAPRP